MYMQSFSILLGLGTLFGLLLTVWRAPEKEALRYLDAAILTLCGALIGSRVVMVAVNHQYYQTHPDEILKVWLGGMSGIGAIVGGVIVLIILASWWQIPAGKLADAMLPLAGSLTITAWLGCWLDSCGYGLPSDMWWALPSRDEWGTLPNRVPVQLAGAAFTLFLVWLLDQASKHFSIQGLSAAIGLFGISAVIFVLSFLRVDPTPIFNGLRLEAWGAFGLMIFSLFVVVVLLFQKKFKKMENPRA
jgi:prolipoprotein diacylglyceryltransferase